MAQDSDLIAHLMSVIEAQFGDRLDEVSRAAVRERVAQLVMDGEALRGVSLGNDNEPAVRFTPWSGESPS